jgi:hypothetical protein
MTIANAIQRGAFVYVFNERGEQTSTLFAGRNRDDGVTGYTSSQVNIRRGGFIYSYDERGQQLETKLAV